MKLETLLGSEENDIWTSDRKKDGIVLRLKFNSLVKRFKLDVSIEEDGLVMASDDSGVIYYKKVLDFEWFQWKPHFSISDIAKNLCDLTDGFTEWVA